MAIIFEESIEPELIRGKKSLRFRCSAGASARQFVERLGFKRLGDHDGAIVHRAACDSAVRRNIRDRCDGEFSLSWQFSLDIFQMLVLSGSYPTLVRAKVARLVLRQ